MSALQLDDGAQFVKDWIKALRSGEYKQCRFTLRNDDGCFCATGVLCDLFVKQGLAKWDGHFFVQDRFRSSFSPSHVIKRIIVGPLQIRSNARLDLDPASVVMSLNDRGSDFQAIANELEKLLQLNAEETR